MSAPILDSSSLRRCLSIRDLSDPVEGPHAMQLVVNGVARAVEALSGCPARIRRQSPIVSVADNYDVLGYAAGAVARDARYSRYVCDTALLRTHTTAMIPSLLREIARGATDDVLVLAPGLVYRRESIDRHHTGEPHQLDVWRLRRGQPLGVADLDALVGAALAAALPDRVTRSVATTHPYTLRGRQLDVRDGAGWVEVGEAGLVAPTLLERHALSPSSWSGLALGLGLDRLLMLRKSIPDIRLLRATDPRIQAQMLDLAPYRRVSTQPSVRRDLSVVLDPEDTLESLGDAVRQALGEDAAVVESVSIQSETPYAALPQTARERLGMRADQRNALVRLILTAYDRSLTHAECNVLRDRVYRAVHRGTRWEWAAGEP